jgi:cardiolipin synthase
MPLTWLVGLIGLAFVVWFVLVVLFAPQVPYRVLGPADARSSHFVTVLESICQTRLLPGNRIDVLTDGPAFYPAMLEAIVDARETINLECYIFRPDAVGRQFMDALAARARAGVRVTIVVDALGSFRGFWRGMRPLREAGCRVEAYQRLHWYRLARLNNRTHRELLVVDGRVAFVGGAGICDWWMTATRRGPMWRDFMARVEGPLVPVLQGIFAENWVECTGEILAGEDTYKPWLSSGSSAALAVRSSPADRATTSRVLFQLLIDGATHRLRLVTPYFLPDAAFRRALARAASRGVDVVVLVPGRVTDQRHVRWASRRFYGELIEHGVRIFEYRPAMIHAKALIVDDVWCAIGTTNLDNRSFQHNDELNIVIRDEEVAARLTADIEPDLAQSDLITMDLWRRRSLWERIAGSVTGMLERQQ